MKPDDAAAIEILTLLIPQPFSKLLLTGFEEVFSLPYVERADPIDELVDIRLLGDAS